MDRDHNLLFGIFAVQLNKVTPRQLMDVAGAWALDRERSLSDRLVEAGALSPDDQKLLEGLIGQVVQAHNGDSAAAVEAFGGDEQINRTFHGSIVLSASGEISLPSSSETVLAQDSPDAVQAVQESPGRYANPTEYARGGMGRVLLVHDTHLGRDIALKELLPDLAPPPDKSPAPTPVRASIPIMARFLQEARITGQLEHPAIIPVYELGYREDGSLYYTMKLVRGKSLAKAFKKAGTLRKRLDYLSHFIDLCQAVAYAHSRRVIHRDLKPANIMVGEFGETVVLDWGLAKAQDKLDVHASGLEETLRAMNVGDEQDVSKTTYGQVMGTPAYMPPEQAKGQLDAVDARSDIYSLGAILYELLTGKAPYEGLSAREIIGKVLNETPAPIASLDDNVPPELAAICERAMSREASKRYKTAKDLAEEVQRFLSGSLVSAYAYGASELLKRFLARNKTIVATCAAALMLLVGLGVFYNLRLLESRDSERDQRIAAQAAQVEAEQAREDERRSQEETRNLTYLATISFANQYFEKERLDLAENMLWDAPEDQRGWEWGYLMNKFRGETYRFTGHSGPVHSCGFSPDGLRLLTGGGDEIKVWNAKTGREILSIDCPLVKEANFNHDATRIAAATGRDAVEIFDAATGQKLQTFAHDGAVSNADFSGDSRLLVCFSEDLYQNLWDVQSGKRLFRFPTGEKVAGVDAVFSPDGRQVAVKTSGPSKVFDTVTGELLATLTGPVTGGDNLTYSPDGRYLAEPGINIWDTRTFTKVATLDGYIVNGCFSPDGKYLVLYDHPSAKIVTVPAWDTPVALPDTFNNTPHKVSPHGERLLLDDWEKFRILDLKTQEIVKDIVLPFRPKYHRNRRFSPDGTLLVAGFMDNMARAWAVNQGDGFREYKLDDVTSGTSALSKDWTKILCFSGMRCTVWDLRTNSALGAWGFANEYALTAALSNDASSLLVGGERPALWDIATGARLFALDEFEGRAQDMKFSPDGAMIATASTDHTARLWDVKTGAELKRLEGHTETVTRVMFIAEGARAATVSRDGTARIWDTGTGEEVQVFSGHEKGVSNISFNADETRAVTISGDNKVRIWDVASRESLAALAGPTDHSANTAEFSPDGERLVVAYTNDTVWVWDWQKEEEVLQLGNTANGRESGRAAFDASGTRIITSGGGVSKISDAATGFGLITLPGTLSSVGPDSFSPDGTMLATMDSGRVRFWKAAPWRAEDLPGDSTASWGERFAQYYPETWLPLQGRNSEKTSMPDAVIVVARPFLLEQLRDLKKQLVVALADPDSQEFLSGHSEGIPTSAWRIIYSKLGFAPGSSITSVGGVKVAADENGVETLAKAIAEFEANRPDTFMLEILRGETRQRVKYELLEQTTIETHKTLPTFPLKALLLLMKAEMKKEMESRSEEEIQKELNRIQSLGLNLAYADDMLLNFFKQLDLGPSDTIVKFDGKDEMSGQQILDFLAELERKLIAGETVSMTLEVERGTLQRRVIHVQFKD